MSSMTLKTVFNDDLRRFVLPKPSFAALKQSLIETYPELAKAEIVVKYLDDEDELITITSDAELVEANSLSVGGKKSALKLFVSVKSEANASATAASESKTKDSGVKEPSKSGDTPKLSPLPASAQSAPPFKPARSNSSSNFAPKVKQELKPLSREEVIALVKKLLEDSAVQAVLPAVVDECLGVLASPNRSAQKLLDVILARDLIRNHSAMQTMLPHVPDAVPLLEHYIQMITPMHLMMARMYAPQLTANLPLVLSLLPMLGQSGSGGFPGFGSGGGGPFPWMNAFAGAGGPGAGSGPAGFNPWAAMGAGGGFPFSGFPGASGFGDSAAAAAAAASSSASASSSSAASPSSPETKEEDEVHVGVECDVCHISPIKGARFKCTVCPDWDCCAACEATTDHAVKHPLLKMRAAAAAAAAAGPGGWRGRFGGFGRGGGGMGRWGGRNPWASAGGPAAGPSERNNWRQGCHGGNSAGKPFKASFVTDVTLPDRTEVGPAQTLIKTWSMNNCGSQQWPEPTNLVFLRGHRELIPGAQEEFRVQSAKPNETVEISVEVLTPGTPGRYTAFFRLADSERNMFGPRMWVDIIVPGPGVGAADDAAEVGSPLVSTKELKAAAKEEAKAAKMAAKEEAKALKQQAREVKKEAKQISRDAKLALKETKKEQRRVKQTDGSTSPSAPPAEETIEGQQGVDAEEAKDGPSEKAEKADKDKEDDFYDAGEGEKPASASAASPASPEKAAAMPEKAEKPGKKFVSKYPIQQTALYNMGFENEELNEFLLDKEKGNVQTVCNWLLEKMR